jgi:tetratricopeptide (TPR) repeat protein
MVNRSMFAAALCFAIALTTVLGSAGQAQPTPAEAQRFDELVRADFFAGVAGDAAALDRAMRLIEATLAANPERPEVLVWHGAGLVTRAGQAFEKGDTAAGDGLWQRGLKEMDQAVAMAPDNVAVLIPRGATLLEVSRSVPDADQAKGLLATGVADYEKVLVLQAPYFKYLSDHSRGELLFGLAEGLHRLGERDRARTYFKRLVSEARNSEYGSMAAAWLNDPSGASARQRGCVGCHYKKASALPAQTPPAQGWTAVAGRLERAALNGSTQELREVRAQLIRELPQSPGEQPESLGLYAIAYAGWRMATLPDVPKSEQDGLLDDAADRLEAILKTSSQDAEALALVGAIYGQQAGRSMMRAIVLGPRSMGALERAAEVESANPRVLLQQGITALHTPSAFGGSRDKAEHLLRRSLHEFSREPRTKAWPNWGRFDAHAWLGQVLRRNGDLDGARAEYQKALSIAPRSSWLRTVLLPALERSSKQ